MHGNMAEVIQRNGREETEDGSMQRVRLGQCGVQPRGDLGRKNRQKGLGPQEKKAEKKQKIRLVLACQIALSISCNFLQKE